MKQANAKAVYTNFRASKAPRAKQESSLGSEGESFFMTDNFGNVIKVNRRNIHELRGSWRPTLLTTDQVRNYEQSFERHMISLEGESAFSKNKDKLTEYLQGVNVLSPDGSVSAEADQFLKSNPMVKSNNEAGKFFASQSAFRSGANADSREISAQMNNSREHVTTCGLPDKKGAGSA